MSVLLVHMSSAVQCLCLSSVDGVWSAWSGWEPCDVTCGGSVQRRHRVCDGPFYGGADCRGASNESQACNVHHCPGPSDSLLRRLVCLFHHLPSSGWFFKFYFISKRKAVALNKHLHAKIYRTVWTLSSKTWTNRKPEKGPKKMRPETAVSFSFRIWIPLS